MVNSPLFDYVVMGGGTAGCIVASNLSENKRNSVLLIEAGGDADRWTVRIPGALRAHFAPNSKTNWFYRSKPQLQLSGRSITLHSGRLYGGSSSINGMLFILPTPYDLLRWRQMTGVEGWSWKDVEPFVHLVREKIPTKVSRNFDTLSERFVESSVALGHRYISDINESTEERLGVFHYPAYINSGTRWASFKGYLEPWTKRLRNLYLQSNSLGKDIIFRDNRAIGCRYVKDGVTHCAYAKKEVILCAGVFGSPAILMRSGIGDLKALSQMGINGIYNNSHVGKHVIDHPEIDIQHRCPIEYSLNRYLTTGRMLKEGLKWMFLRRGAAAVNQAFAGAFLSFRSTAYPEYQLYCWPAYFADRVAVPGQGGFKIGIDLCYPKSEGKITLNPVDPYGDPDIDLKYLSDEEDLKIFIEAFQHTRRILSQVPLGSLTSGEERPGSGKMSAEQIGEYIRASVDSGYHLTSSCRMASTETEGVTDKRGAVFGVDNLRVMDASIFPTNVGCNPAATTMIVAHRLSLDTGDL